jgi:uncharacterized protein YdaU (DUF1376 family)
MASKSPAFQFYAAEYLADENVVVMTLEEEGAYIRALSYCWREGSIPADNETLARLLKGASNQTLTVVRKRFNQCSTNADRLVHSRLEAERKKQAGWREKSSIAGKRSGNVRRNKKLQTEPTFNQPSTNLHDLVEPNANSSSSSSSSNKNKYKYKAPQAAFDLPSWIPKDAWDGFLEMRRKKRVPSTGRALEGIVRNLDKLRGLGFQSGEVLDQSTVCGWTGVFPIKNLTGAASKIAQPGINHAEELRRAKLSEQQRAEEDAAMVKHHEEWLRLSPEERIARQNADLSQT